MKNLPLTRPLVIAVDFDGTIVEHRAPKIGPPMPKAFETLKALQNEGHRLILWTYRDGDALQEAKSFCEAHGVRFFAVNNSFPHEEYHPIMSRKINADVFIDDRNIGGFIGWEKIGELLLSNPNYKKTRKLRQRSPMPINLVMRMMNLNFF